MRPGCQAGVWHQRGGPGLERPGSFRSIGRRCDSVGSLRPDVVQRERRVGDRSQRESEQRPFPVISGHAVAFESSATGTPVHDCPLSVAADLDSDRHHRRSARFATIAGLVIEMTRPEADGAMVAVACTEALSGDLELAIDACERCVLVRFVRHGCGLCAWVAARDPKRRCVPRDFGDLRFGRA